MYEHQSKRYFSSSLSIFCLVSRFNAMHFVSLDVTLKYPQPSANNSNRNWNIWKSKRNCAILTTTVRPAFQLFYRHSIIAVALTEWVETTMKYSLWIIEFDGKFYLITTLVIEINVNVSNTSLQTNVIHITVSMRKICALL